jgi:hypothetical protein
MPYKVNEPRRHKISKARYKIESWAEYDAALRQRGSLTVWVTPEAIAAWLRAAGSAAGLLRRRDRDRVDAAAGVRPALAPDRGPARLGYGPAWSGIAGSGPHDMA